MGTCTPEIVESLPVIKTSLRSKRQRRNVELKRQIVEETLVAGASVARVARAHGVNANQLFAWRRQYEAGQLGQSVTNPARLLPVSVAETPTETALRRNPENVVAGTIHLEIGKTRVRIEGRVDPELLRLVLQALRG